MNKNKLIFLDTETTGTGPEDRLCQVAYAFEGREVEALFLPPLPISVDAMSVTHITNKMVADKESFIGSSMYAELTRIFAEGNILVAHNAKFDAEILRREGIVVKEMIDTFKLSHHLDSSGIIPRHALQYLRYYHDLDVENASAHDALGDVRVLRKLFDFYFDQMMAKLGSEEAALQEMLGVSARPILIKKFNFGKYAGQDVAAVAYEDKPYIAWLLNQKVMTRENGGDDDDDWIYTLEYHLNRQS